MEKQYTINEYIEIILRYKWFLILSFVASTAIATGVSLSLPPIYRSSTLVLVDPQKVPEEYVRSTVTDDIQERLETITQQVTSRTSLEKIIEDFDLYKEQRGKVPKEKLVEKVRKDIEIKVSGKTSFSITYQGRDPKTVMMVTNALASSFIDKNLIIREQRAEGTSEFLENQLEELKKELERQEKGIQNFKRRYMGELPSQVETNLRSLDRFQLELQATTEALTKAQDRKNQLLKDIEEARRALGGQNQMAEVRPDQLETLKRELATLQTEYTDKYPDIIRLKNEIKELEERLKRSSQLQEESTATPPIPYSSNVLYQSLVTQHKEANLEISALKVKQKNLTNQIERYQKMVEAAPAREQELMGLMRDYENTKGNYQSLLSKKLEAKLSENLEKRQKGEQFRMIDPADLPTKPFKPDRPMIILIGMAVGLSLGIGLIFFVEYMDTSFRKAEDLQGVIQLPVLVTIPKIE